MKILSKNPHDQSVVGEIESSTQVDIQNAVSSARNAYQSWKALSVAERLHYVRLYREKFIEHREELARLMTEEMGKPLSQSLREIDGRTAFLDYYLKESENNLADELISEDAAQKSFMTFEPLGVIAVIAPWNYPTSAITAGIIPALIAGNTVVFKPSEHSTLSQKRAVEIFAEIGLPSGVLTTVVGDGEVGRMLVDSEIDMVWFTGSTKVGQEIYRRCGEKFIKAVCELGGSSAGIIFADADIEKAVAGIYSSRFINSGQLCNAVKRLFVEKPIYTKIVEHLKTHLEKVTIGNPLTHVDFGPLVSKEQLAFIETQVADAVSKGAQIIIGGKRPNGAEFENGNYFEPTILTNTNKIMSVMTEEVFGPVLPIIPFSTEAEVISMANDTEYGLSAEVFTQDMKKGERLSRALESGLVLVNGRTYARAASPIGGFKKSGIGRQYGKLGMHEFTQQKLIAITKQ